MRVNSKDWVFNKKHWSWSIWRQKENGIMKTSVELSDSPGGNKGKCNRRLSYKEALTGKLESIPIRNSKFQSPGDSDNEDPSLDLLKRDNTISHHSKHRPRDINECVRRENPTRQEILSSSSPSAPSSPSPPIRTRWWPPRTESVSPRTSFHRSGPEQSRGGWHRQFQHHFPTSSGMVFSAPHGVRTARSHHAWRGNININQHARHRPSTRNRFYDSSSELFPNNPVSRKVLPRLRSHRGGIKSQNNRDKQKCPTPIVSISTAFNLEDEMSKNPPSRDQVSKYICFPTCTGRRESTVHFYPDRFTMPSYSFDMIFYQKLALVLGSKGKTLF